MESKTLFQNRIDLEDLNQKVNQIKKEIGKVIIGQEKMLDLLMVCLLSKGHVLIEGIPGVAKTLSAKLMAKCISADFSRLQFTPDLMPSDVLGTTVFNMAKSEFEFNKGPIFSNIVLIDEINRAPAKTQAALFEVMQENQVSMDGTTYQLDDPFWVLATQNPIDQEGTYRLPEAQLDRFLMKIDVGYPSLEEELEILNTKHNRRGKCDMEEVNSLISVNEICNLRDRIQALHIDENLRKYIAKIVHKTRNHPALLLGASPRASLAVMIASKAFAAIQGRDFVTPEDILEMAIPCLHHRLILTPEKEMEGVSSAQIMSQIIEGIEVPR